MDYANEQPGVPSGLALARAHQEIALEGYRLVGPTLVQVALWGPCGAFPAIIEQRVVMALTWPWWPLEGFDCGHVELTTLLKEVFS